MARKRSYLQTSTTAAHKCEHTPRKATRPRSRMQSTNSTRRGTWCCCVAPSTSKSCDATTSTTCTLASSTSGTWSSDEFRAARTGTSYHRLGRGRSSSTKCSDPELTRFSTGTRGSSPMHGTSNTYAVSSLSNCSNLIHQ
jgi:hypothetical protein